MKKNLILGVGLSVVLMLFSCKSKESAYKKAYEQAQSQQTVVVDNAGQQQTPVEVTPVTPVTPVQKPVDVSREKETVEKVTVVSGEGLLNYSVVCGSFGVKANAERLQRELSQAGYKAQIVFNSARSMYRVVASTWNDKAAAVQSRDVLRSDYPDAWLLKKN